MTVAYWTVAGLLALLYLWSGGMKILRSRERLQPMMNWVDDMPMPRVRAIGVAEVLGAIGLVVPPLTGIAPAPRVRGRDRAAGALQLAATSFHLRRGEKDNIGLNIGLVVATAVLVWLATIWL